MPTHTPLLRIHDMLESIRGIEKAIKGKSYRDYERSWVLRSAIERGVEVISEASRHLDRKLKSPHKDVRWKDIAGIAISCGMSTSALMVRSFGRWSRVIFRRSSKPYWR
jgi:uncharacterized protein with HEPN domain